MEEVLQSTMFDVPGRDDVARVVVTRDAVIERVAPSVVEHVIDAAPRKGRQSAEPAA